MNVKYKKYIDYIINDIKPPYFKCMRDHYGLKDNECVLVLSKVYNESVTIKDKLVYDSNDNNIYWEDTNYNWSKYEYSADGNYKISKYFENSDGEWRKYEYDTNGNEIYSENSNDYWTKYEYDTNGNRIYSENSNGFWTKWEYDTNGNVIYREYSNGDWYKREYDTNGNIIYTEYYDGVIIDNR